MLLFLTLIILLGRRGGYGRRRRGGSRGGRGRGDVGEQEVGQQMEDDPSDESKTHEVDDPEAHYYRKYFEQYSMNIKKVWIGIKGIINIKTKYQNSPNFIGVDYKLVMNNAGIPN